MFSHKAVEGIRVSHEQVASLALLVKESWGGVPSVRPEHTYYTVLGKEYHVRRQRPFQKHPALYRIATTEWAVQFFASDDSFPFPQRDQRAGIMAVWDVKFAGDEAVFENDLIMFRVAL